MTSMFRKKKPADQPKPKSQGLFDDEETPPGEFDQYTVTTDRGSYVDMSFEEFEITDMRGKARQGQEEQHDDHHEDKIFGNSYNSGDVQMTRLSEIKVRADYAGRLDCYNPDSAYIRMKLTERCEQAFADGPWKSAREELKNEKFPKALIPYVFNDLYQAMDDGYTSTTDRFIAIAELLESSYEKVYQAVPVKIKERLLDEIDEANGAITGKRITRLF